MPRKDEVISFFSVFAPVKCDNDLPGIQTAASCCLAACGRCGGSNCHLLGGGLGANNCCQGAIARDGQLCSITGAAPCVVDGKIAHPVIPSGTYLGRAKRITRVVVSCFL